MARSRRSYYSSSRQKSYTASIVWDNIIQAYRVNFSYNKAIVDLLKSTIPASDRDYKPKENHTWVIHEKYFEPIRELLEAKFGKHNVNILEKEESQQKWEEFNNYIFQAKAINYSDEITKFVGLLREAGIQFDINCSDGKLALKAYRRAAMFFHPDRNPDFAGKMSELNSTFQNLKEFYGLGKQESSDSNS